jgi:hypothetical protein
MSLGGSVRPSTWSRYTTKAAALTAPSSSIDASGREGGNHCHVRAAVQRHRLAARDPAVAPRIRQVHAGFVHELKPSYVLARQRFEEVPAQGFHPFGVALGGVDALFLRRKSSACPFSVSAGVTWPRGATPARGA